MITTGDSNSSSFDAVFEPKIDIAGGDVPGAPAIGGTESIQSEAPASKDVRFEIIRELNELENSVVWIVYRKNGQLSPSSLLEDSLEKALVKAQRKGVTEEDNFSLFISRHDETGKDVHFLLFSPPESTEFKDRHVWIEQVVETISGLGLKRIGLHMDPSFFDHGKERSRGDTREFLPLQNTRSLLFDTVLNLCRRTSVRGIFFWQGFWEYASILNAVIAIKSALDEEQIPVTLTH